MKYCIKIEWWWDDELVNLLINKWGESYFELCLGSGLVSSLSFHTDPNKLILSKLNINEDDI